MSKANKLNQEIFMQYSRPIFRTCEIICNHAARVFMNWRSLSHPDVRSEIDILNRARIDFQRELNEIGASHGHVCADCKGKCCGGVRERDAYIDRILQDPETDHLSARRKCGEMAAYKIIRDENSSLTLMEAEWNEGHCPELTMKGCKIPYELRPIQCTAYFCRPTVNELSDDECHRGIRALVGLMRVQMKTVALAIRSRRI